MPNNIHARSRQTLGSTHSFKFPPPPRRHTNKKSIDALRASPTSLKISISPASSATDIHEFNTKPPLLALPPELLLKILGNLQDLEDLFSAILACRRIFDIFQEAQRPLIESTFGKCMRMKTDRGIHRALIQLSRIIQRDIIHRDVVRHIFETGWGVFRGRHQEDLLIPFGRALAWSYVLNDRQADAVCLLRRIQKGEPPFGWSTILSQPPIQPIRELFEQLAPEETDVDRKHIGPDLDHPLVEIKSNSKKGALILNHIEQSTLLKVGILFRKNSIVMRKSKPYSLGTCPQHTFHYGIYRHGSIRNENMNGDIRKALAHQPTTSYTRGRQNKP